ncbi:MAG: signal peptidase II [Pseudomonadota bacterium]
MLRLALVIAAVVLVLDQISKVWLLGVMEANAYLPIEITGFFNLVMVWNEGVSFGMLDVGTDMMRWILMAFALGVAVALLVWAHRAGGKVLTVGIGLIAGGAVGNALDRLFYGAVADFFDVHVSGYHWPAFNIADSAITIGVVLLLYDTLFNRRPDPKVSA